MNELSAIAETRGLRRIIALSGGAAMTTGILALAAWMSGAGALTSIFPEYIPMAVSAAILSSGFGLLFLSGAYRLQNGISRILVLAGVAIFTMYALLKFLGYFLGTDLTFDHIFFPANENLGQYIINRMSPIGGLLFFLCGIAILTKMLSRERLSMLNLVSGIGFIILFSGFTGLIGYLFKTPFFYGGNIIPISLPMTFNYVVLGCGLVSMGGTHSFFLRFFYGTVASSGILRALLPIIVLSLLADDLLYAALSQISPMNHVLISAAVALLLIPITIWIVITVSQAVFRRADMAEDSRRKAEAALRVSEKEYRLLVENQGEGVGLVSPDECFVYANPAAERIFGVPPGGLTGRCLTSFLLPDQVSRVLRETEKRTQAEPSTYELNIITPGKQVRYLLVTATPQLNDNGIFTGTFGVFRDISSRKQVELELEKFSKALQESNATKDKFFSIIAHDLKGPFNSILGLTNLLISDYQLYDDEEVRNTLSTIKKSSERAFELLENLLLWANSQTGNISFTPREFNLQRTIDETIALLEVQSARKKISILSCSEEDCIITGDEQMIQTVLRNLMSNAIKFTYTGGEVAVSVTRGDDKVVVSVKDTGTGIAENDIPKLFKIESKYSTSGTSDEKGTGLGLILCKEFVEKHGGKLWVESELGKGSTFYFTLFANRL
ncbi:MAG: PAS domain-containing sensor histidine kinase [Bacteroidota bacterium]